MKYLFLSLLIVFQSVITIQNKPFIKGDIKESSLTNINETVDHINQGGCGYFAMKLYEILDSSKYSIVKIGNYQHVAILDKTNHVFIDSRGISTTLWQCITSFSTRFEVISYNILRKRVYEGRWNKKFNFNDTSTINNLINHLKYKNEKVTDSISY